MALLPVLGLVVAVVGGLLLLTVLLCVDRDQWARLRSGFPDRIGTVLPPVGILAGVLLLNSFVRQLTDQLSWLIGINISGLIFKAEGNLVADIQQVATPELTLYFSFVYVFGYILLLVFPLVAYFSLERLDRLYELTLAYTANYLIGLLLYLLFIAYGPRNLGVAEQFMYEAFPQFQFLTFTINMNTNVFPSLHTSLSVTVMLFAWRTRTAFPRWLLIASVLGSSVMVATVYLGIHWLIDVIGGILLGWASYRIGIRWRDQWATALPSVKRLRPAMRHRN